MKILIADDHPIFRKGLADILSEKFRNCAILEAQNGLEAKIIIKEEEPSIVILDIEMPKIDGLKVCQSIKQKKLPIKVIILTMYKNEEIFKLAMEYGADGFVLKDNSAKELMDCLKIVMTGKEYISPEMEHYLKEKGDALGNKKQLEGGLKDLTKTEIKVLSMVSQNYSSREIAEKIFVTPKSVENYRSRICKKLGLHGGHNTLAKWVIENKTVLDLLV